MYLLYVDESGQHKGSRGFDHFVMGGVAVRDEDCYPFSRSIDAVLRRVIPAHSDFELHATDIIAGRNEWAPVPAADRIAVLDAVFDHLRTWQAASGHEPKYFAVAIHRPSFPGKDLLKMAHMELFRRFDTFLSRLHVSGDSHRSIVIADDSSYEKIVQKLVPEWKRKGTSIGRLHSMIEVPLFVDSKASRMVQVADFVAWAAFNYYERGHTTYLQALNGRFDADAGIQHGLAHFVKRYRRCACVPCASRRTNAVNTLVTPWPIL